jgi:preprotein translocase subunit YajC
MQKKLTLLLISGLTLLIFDLTIITTVTAIIIFFWIFQTKPQKKQIHDRNSQVEQHTSNNNIDANPVSVKTINSTNYNKSFSEFNRTEIKKPSRFKNKFIIGGASLIASIGIVAIYAKFKKS